MTQGMEHLPDRADGIRPPGTPGRSGVTRLLRLHPRVTVAVALVLVALVAAAALIVPRVLGRPGPDDAVRDYLTAIQRRDVPRALRAAGVAAVPAGPAGAFLTAGAIRSGWRVGRVTEIRSSRRDGGRSVDVRAGLVDTLLSAAPPVQHAGTFHLRRDGDRWRIENPFVAVRFASTPLWYVEITGVRLPRTALPAPSPAGDTSPVYQLFPGLYTPYADGKGLVTVRPASPLVAMPPLAGEPVPLRYEPTITPTDRTVRAAQEEFRHRFDRCVADQAQGHTSCTITFDDVLFRNRAGSVERSDVTSGRWSIVRYPTVSLPGTEVLVADDVAAYVTQVTVPGVLRYTATGRTPDGHPLSFVQTCYTRRDIFSPWGITVGIGADAAPVTAWRNPHSYYDRPTTETWLTLRCHGDTKDR